MIRYFKDGSPFVAGGFRGLLGLSGIGKDSIKVRRV